MAGRRENLRSGRGTSAAPSEQKASKWFRTARTMPRILTRCSDGRMSQGQKVIADLYIKFLKICASRGRVSSG